MNKIIPPALFYTLVVSLGGFIFGFDASVISGAIGFISEQYQLTSWQQGFVVSSPTLGGLFATLFAGVVSDAIGRRKTLIVIAVLFVISAAASALAQGYWMLVIARFIGGMAFCSLMVAPMYIAEISLPEHRGKLVSINQLNIVLGFSVSYFSNYCLLQWAQSDAAWVNTLALDEHLWRWMLGLELIPALCWLVLLFVIPRSPRWLLMQRMEEEAESVAIKLFSAQQIDKQLGSMRASLQQQVPPLSERIKTVFGAKLRFALMIGLLVAVAQQITGINVIFFYAPTIFEQSGVGTNTAFAQAVWIGVVNVLFTLVAMLSIDRYGRKPLLLFGLSGIAISMALCSWGFNQATYRLDQKALTQLNTQVPAELVQSLETMAGATYANDVVFKEALAQRLGEQQLQSHQGKIMAEAITMNATLVLVGITLFVAAFAVSLGPVMWVMFSEIFPNAVRAVAISVVTVINNGVSFLVQLVFPWELAKYGAAVTFALYGVFALLSLLLVWRYLPETKGKSLEQLELDLSYNQERV
ncbi:MULTISPECIES: sugar porter family MFS transporter [unclassified Pseudoalteromonas]|uniref:sugar porter family MFS transporter n=1 Tax=unclassified Pseudoalteromonas TaxID=194690 RepID=UPI000CF6C1E2|nr:MULTISPECIES: sugar porter family MFS transporter [unclassified Pseudoalteromonas]MBS3798001.1 sugar porter family MFS transporter [Pseudoalteromonas sp. BDTF-M6]